MQGQCKPNAIELARIAEVQPVLAFDNAKLGRIFVQNKENSRLFAHTVLLLTCVNSHFFKFRIRSTCLELRSYEVKELRH